MLTIDVASITVRRRKKARSSKRTSDRLGLAPGMEEVPLLRLLDEHGDVALVRVALRQVGDNGVDPHWLGHDRCGTQPRRFRCPYPVLILSSFDL